MLRAQAAFLARHPEVRRGPVELIQTHVDQLRDAQAVAVGEQDHGVVAGAVAALLRRLEAQLDLVGGEVVAGFGVDRRCTLDITVRGHQGSRRGHGGSGSSRGDELLTLQPFCQELGIGS